MTDVTKDAQKQDPGSQFIELWELEIGTDTYAYFHSGIEADLTTIQFRDQFSGGTTRTYTALPIHAEGFNIQSSGPSARPTIQVANLLSSFSDALGGLTNEDLLGKKIYRRTTLYKYAIGQSGDANPPVEFPIQMWFIDRIAEKTPMQITFELSSAFDLFGTTLPRRNIIGNACAWIYQGGSEELDEEDQIGGCKWDTYSRISDDGTSRTVYFNVKDEQVVLSSLAGLDTAYASGTGYTVGQYRRVAKTDLTQINADRTLTTGQSSYDYWQITRTCTPGPPGDTNSNWRRIRVYSAYSTSTTYKGYTDLNYNEYVTYDRGNQDVTLRLWQVKHTTQYTSAHPSTPTFNTYWKIGDQCSKTLKGCARRFRSSFGTVDSETRRIIVQADATLPFGGFPGSRVLK